MHTTAPLWRFAIIPTGAHRRDIEEVLRAPAR